MPPPPGPFPEEPPRRLSFRESMEGVFHFIRYYRPFKALAALDLAAILTQAALTVLIPAVVYRIFDTALRQKDLSGLLILSGIAFLLMALIAAAEYVSLRWGHILGAKMEAGMREDMFAHLQQLSFSYFDRTKTGHLMSRISNDLTQLSETAHHAPEDLIVSLLTVIGAFSVMFHMNPLLAAVTVVPLPLLIVWGSCFQRRMRAGFRRVRESVAELNRGVENSLQGIREIKSFRNEELETERFRRINGDFLGAKIGAYRIMAAFHGGITFLLQTYSLLFLGAGALLMYWNKADFPQIMAFFMYSRYITMPVMRMLHFTEQFQQAGAAFDRFREVMREVPELHDPETPAEPDRLCGEIEFKNVCFQYPTRPDIPVLKRVSFRIPAGTAAALVGESGAGKSTIASLIPRFYDVTDGILSIDGIPVREFRQDFLHRNIGLVPQSPFLFDASIRENIRFGRPDASPEEVEKAARNARVTDFADQFPEGLDTQVGERGVKLSGGQRQRISIARVFLKDPPILIFDEATSSLDNESEERIRQAMETLCGGRTSLIIAHRLSTIRHAQKILCLRSGELTAAGTHTELLEKDPYYRHLYEMHTF